MCTHTHTCERACDRQSRNITHIIHLRINIHYVAGWAKLPAKAPKNSYLFHVVETHRRYMVLIGAFAGC